MPGYLLFNFVEIQLYKNEVNHGPRSSDTSDPLTQKISQYLFQSFMYGRSFMRKKRIEIDKQNMGVTALVLFQ